MRVFRSRLRKQIQKIRRLFVTAGLSFWRMVFALIFTGSLLLFGAFLFSPRWVRAGGMLQVDLRSPHRADYGVDPFVAWAQPARMSLVGDAVLNRSSAESDTQLGVLATLVDQMKSPVPSVTPGPLSPQQPVITVQPSTAAVPSANPTSTPEPFPTPSLPVTETATAAVVVLAVSPTAQFTASLTATATLNNQVQPAGTTTPHSPITNTPQTGLEKTATQPADTSELKSTRTATVTLTLTSTPTPTTMPGGDYPPPAEKTPGPTATPYESGYPGPRKP